MYGPEGAVLGTTTTTVSALALANTGANTVLNIVVGFALIAGVVYTLLNLSHIVANKEK